MEYASLFVAGLAVFTVAFNSFLKWAEQPKKRFPWCRNCKSNMYRVSILDAHLPYEVQRYLSDYQLPSSVLSKFNCPKGDTELWFIPRLGNATKGLFFVRDK